jgi:hypothetical protein
MKQYLLAVHYVEGQGATPPEEMEKAFAQVAALNEELQAKDVWVFGGGLMPPETSTVVRASADGTTMTDGPFAEAKEQIGGFWVIKAADLDEALAWAERASAACMGPVDVRPFQDEP